MFKKLRKTSAIISCCLLSNTFFTTACLTSCNVNETPITAIELYPDSTTIRPNESFAIRAVVQPSGLRTNDLIWELVDCPYDAITISKQGILSASLDLSVTDLSKITVKAIAPKNADVFSTCEISILPLPTYDFQGFVNNEIQYLDKSHSICSMPLIKKSEFEYETKANIDIFEMDDQPLPDPSWTSLINFTPIISATSMPYMNFALLDGEYARHSIQWDTYDDGAWTDTVPAFTTTHPEVMFDVVNVHFACDPRVCLTINFNSWQNPWQQVVDTKVDYIPEQDNDPHFIDRQEESVYRCDIFCPAESRSIVFSKTLSSIYVFRPKYEYLLFRFEIVPLLGGVLDPESSIYDPSFEKMLKTSPQIGSTFEPKMYERSIDHLRYYKFDLDYQFDLTLREHTAEYWHGNKLPIFAIRIFDTDGESEYLAGEIDFYVDWV